jgi:hypothetical protein
MRHSPVEERITAPELTAQRPRALRRRVWLLCVALILAALVYDLVSPPIYTATLILSVVTPIAAALLPFRDTLIIGGLTLTCSAVMQLVLHADEEQPHDLLELCVLVTLALISLYVCWERTRREVELTTTRAVAEITQRAVLPTVPAEVDGLPVGVRYEAAYSPSRIGGDLYAVEQTGHGIRMIIGDVRGKGLNTIRTVAALTGSFREAAHHAADLETLADWLEQSQHRLAEVDDSGPGDGDAGEWFTTALLLEVAKDQRSIRILNCGHPPPLLIGADSVRPLPARNPRPPLGLGDLADDPDGASTGDRQVESVPRNPGDVLVLYTDGLSEARNAAGEFYDPVPLLERHRGASMEDLLADLGDGAIHWSGGRLADDMALLVVG